jgi:hypothetical protein
MELSDTKIRNAEPVDQEYTLADGHDTGAGSGCEWNFGRRATEMTRSGL